MAEFFFQDRIIEFTEELRQHVAKNMENAALFLGDVHRNNLSAVYPPASTPGEFPAMRTGNLQQSVIINPPVASEIAGKGYVDVIYDEEGFYGYILTSGRFNRLGIADTFRDILPELGSILTRPMKL